jgi:aryl-alcohol dehydrogenase-like predicted oxidoreductase
MDYRPLGNSGLLVSSVGLGCNNFGGRIDMDASRAVVERALDEGITFFDTADIYGGHGRSEEILGVLLEGRRDEVVVATKFGHADVDMGFGPAAGAKGSRAYVRRAIEASLRRLRTDHIDLYQLHTPDPVTPIAETLAALHELVAEGKVRYIGHSNFSSWQLAEAVYVADELGVTPFVSAQTTGRCSTAASNASSCRRRSTTASASFPTSRSRRVCSPERSSVATPYPRAPGCTSDHTSSPPKGSRRSRR